MSLIDPKHLVAPLRNKTHLFTIMAVVVTFGLFRYLGGGLTTDPQPKRLKSVETYEDPSNAVDVESVPDCSSCSGCSYCRSNAVDVESVPGDELESVDSYSKDSYSERKVLKKTNPMQGDKNDAGKNELEDIEKAMGLR